MGSAVATQRTIDIVGRHIDQQGPPAALKAVAASGFAGRVLVARGDEVIMRAEFGEPNGVPDTRPQEQGVYGANMVWPWASVTKQVTATLVMQEVALGHLALDVSAAHYLPGLAGRVSSPTIRQLLQHQSGLRNADDSAPDTLSFAWKGKPGFYSIGPTGVRWCLAARGAPGGIWRYNNCDYIVLGAVLERVTGEKLNALFRTRIAVPLGLKSSGFARDPSAPHILSEGFYAGPLVTETSILARFGAAGALMGSEDDLLAFDRGLLAGKLLSAGARATMWAGDPKLGYMALGQWVFEARLKGCARPLRIVERRGEIGRFEVRNILLPDKDMAIIAFTNHAGFDFGEVWQGKGLSYDLLSAAACR
ncbi:serine hydrolase domain-containing protein [uncultured Sphingomonas sp.]|uniref:serine hydrolase domain-containing protein n=1 Tax=uncultured Sphingomonas sp. TaxID=158754 RepID=UPI0035CB74E3